MIIHKKHINKILFISPFALNIFLIRFFHPPMVILAIIILRPWKTDLRSIDLRFWRDTHWKLTLSYDIIPIINEMFELFYF